jgi:hypothetical protein
VTYAPADLLAVRAYLMAQTGLPANALGIPGDPDHAESGGYHEGNDDLARVGRLNTDYSKRESARDRPGTNAASAIDVGDFNRGGKTLRGLSVWLAGRCQAGDPRTADIREIIYSPDGRTVRRWDRLGIRSTGDNSHLFHTHLSFFRDSEGRRDEAFLSLLREYFEGAPTYASSTQEDPMDLLVKAGDLATGQLWLATGGTRYPITTAVGERRQALHRAGVLPLANGGNVWLEPDIAALDAYGQAVDERDAARDAADQTRDAALLAAIQALAVGGTTVDTAAIIAAVNAAAAAVAASVKARFAAAAQAGADAPAAG